MTGTVKVERQGMVAILELDHPPNNHVTVELMRGLADKLTALDKDDGVRASVVATAGRVFCAGADFTPGGQRLGTGGGGGTSDLYVEAARLYGIKKPIVVAVQGAAVGAGLGLALVGDFRVAAPEARLSANFVKLGFHPGFGLTYTLPRLIGTQRAELMFLTGRRIKADEALAWGLVDEIAPLEEVRARAVALAAEIAENAPLAVTATRATMRGALAEAVKKQTAHEFVEQEKLRGTEDFQEGVRAVAERRPGRFVGR